MALKNHIKMYVSQICKAQPILENAFLWYWTHMSLSLKLLIIVWSSLNAHTIKSFKWCISKRMCFILMRTDFKCRCKSSQNTFVTRATTHSYSIYMSYLFTLYIHFVHVESYLEKKSFDILKLWQHFQDNQHLFVTLMNKDMILLCGLLEWKLIGVGYFYR